MDAKLVSDLTAPDDDIAKAATPAPPAPAIEAVGWREVLQRGGLSTLVVLAAINLFDYLDSAILVTAGPDIQRSLHLSDSALGAIGGLGPAFFVLAAVPVGHLAARVRRTRLAAVCAAVAGLATVATAASMRGWQLGVSRLVTGAGQSAILPVHNAVLADRYPEGGRARVLSAHAVTAPLAAIVGPVLVALCALSVGDANGWRLAFAVAAAGVLALSALCWLLPDPPRGGDAATSVVDEETRLVSVEAGFGRLLAIPSLRWLLLSIGVLGFVLVAVPVFLSVFLEDHFGLGALDRGLLLAVSEVGGAAGLVVGGVLSDRLRQLSDARPLQLLALSTAAFGVLLPVALFIPSVGGFIAALTVARFAFGLGTVAVYAHVAAVSPARLRALGYALVGLYIFVLGGFLGGVITGAVSDAYGTRAALVAVTLPICLIAAALALRGASEADADLAAAADELAEEAEEAARAAAADGDTPLLQVRGLAVSYGGVRVLHSVDLDVQPGEVLALLGTNGAGKSTVLRAISGIVLAERGVIRLDGHSLTHADSAVRVRRGIVQVPGGKAVFPSLSVLDNLLVGTHTYAWNTDQVRSRIERALDQLPALRPRLDQRAGSLSGGEQQMLAIAKALLLEPRILLIDELSLGLAPVLVAELVELVARLKEQGLSIVVVEQSVNVALTIADRAIFLEKGRVRFEGPAADLLARDDLLRAVFLGSSV